MELAACVTKIYIHKQNCKTKASKLYSALMPKCYFLTSKFTVSLNIWTKNNEGCFVGCIYFNKLEFVHFLRIKN